MGNQNSRSTTPTSNPQSPTNNAAGNHHNVTASHGHDRPHNHHHHLPHLHPPHSQHHSARRRESIQALSAAKAPAAPSVSLENAESHPTSARPISRGRAQTAGTSTKAVTTQLRAAQDLYNNTHSTRTGDNMGNEQSSQKGGAHSHKDKDKHHVSPRDANTTPPSQPVAAAIIPDTAAQQQQAVEAEAEAAPEVSARPPSPTLPVDVPSSASHPDPRASSPSDLPSPTSASITADYLIPASASQFSRPPRLPLPIEEEVHTPGSPIIAPQELSGFNGVSEIWTPVHESDADGMLPRRSSMVSSTTAGEDEDGDLGEEFKGSEGRPTVPTLIEWEGPGERVYVTGTFAGWNRKYKLHRNGPSKKKDALSAYVSVTPGTHHLTFLVDNDMRTSDKLPTAVDYTNILVNYIEVPYPELTPLPASPPAATAATNDPLDDSITPVQEREAPVGMYPPQVLPPTPPLNATADPTTANPIPTVTAPPIEPAKPPVPEPTKKYHQNIPRYLLDLDAPEESSRFARANAMTNNLPTPPTLPGFLGKSILNGTTPMKDDSSVLIHPNHTVLNHLATSSIKDNILATSATTRYKQKFLTTIMYKPKEEGGEVY